MLNCDVLDRKIETHCGQLRVFIAKTTAIYSIYTTALALAAQCTHYRNIYIGRLSFIR